MSRTIPQIIQKKLWAHSLGMCGNPQCKKSLFESNQHIGEVAHIKPYAEKKIILLTI